MNNIRIENVDTLPMYLEFIEDLQTEAQGNLWFRGTGKYGYKLLPTLYRHRKLQTPNQFAKMEQELMVRFRQRSIPYHTKQLSDDWATLFFMQHYGIPTRLLDWTENPLIGLYFALMSASYREYPNGSLSFKDDVCVWVLDPVKWNRFALRHQSFEGGVLSTGDDALKGYKPTSSFLNMNSFPVALFGEHNSPRIVAQQGVFTIFGQVLAPMEETFQGEGFPEESLIRVKIKRLDILPMRKSLLRLGITESVVNPDLDGLALEIKRHFHFLG